MTAVPPFRIDFTPQEKTAFLHRARQILDSGQLTLGPHTEDLERAFARMAGTGHAVAVSSGTAALEIIYRTLDLVGSDVLVPANTNYATAEAAIRAGATPVLYDAGLAATADAIGAARTGATKAVVLVHIGGYLSPDLDKITAYCASTGLAIVEDASHAHGSATPRHTAGAIGAAAALSTFATKAVTTGEGGVITTNDPLTAQTARRYRDQGKNDDGTLNVLFGSAWRMPELSAALGLAQLDHQDERTRRASDLIHAYITQITNPSVTVPGDRAHRYSGHKAIVTLPDRPLREDLRRTLLAAGITAARGVYDSPLHRQPALALRGSHPLAEHFADTHLCLPIWPAMTTHDQQRVIDTINHWTP